jgi:starch phosphorylase
MYHSFSYTNHTVLPEALEKWSVSMIGKLLPRHLDLIYLINHFFLEMVKKKYPGEDTRIARMSLIEEGSIKKVRMAFLSIVCCHNVNGVAELHTQLLRTTIFKDFDDMFPGKIQNKTNGVTPRRWIHCCNPGLSQLISETLGIHLEDWITNLTSLRELSAYSTDEKFVQRFIKVKEDCKRRLQSWVKKQSGIDIPLNAMYDVMVKRIHEYKR